MAAVGGRWGLGLQLGECSDASGPRRLAAFGHAASGGTVGLCVPQARLALSPEADTTPKPHPDPDTDPNSSPLVVARQALSPSA
eukprot:4684067-Prymnesium_polylepis.1